MTKPDRIIGSILGGAIGDAFAGPYEGASPPITIDHRSEWRLSDDTQLTLATCEAISKSHQVSPAVIASTFAQWYRELKLTGLGASTYKALSELSIGGHWALVGRKGEMSAGNGAAMRIAPLAFCLDPQEPAQRMLIRDICRITHHNEEAYVGALAVLLAIRAAYVGTWDGQSKLLRLIIPKLPDSSVRDRLVALDQIGHEISLEETALQFGCSGYVVESVPLALFGAQRISEFEFQGLMERLIKAGGDTDTIASMAGQVRGALLGQEGLPKEMVARLPNRNEIMRVAQAFAKTATELDQ